MVNWAGHWIAFYHVHHPLDRDSWLDWTGPCFIYLYAKFNEALFCLFL